MNKDFKFVKNCGDLGRTIFEIKGVVHIGCFEGTYEEAEEAILDKYEDPTDYLDKLELLKQGGEGIEVFDWEGYSWVIGQYCTELLTPEILENKYNWDLYSWAIEEFSPHLMKHKPKA